jgi:hypothetical protein
VLTGVLSEVIFCKTGHEHKIQNIFRPRPYRLLNIIQDHMVLKKINKFSRPYQDQDHKALEKIN